ncbi:DUF4174 domain-containing protein [Rhodobacteraceae bacterium D3-12]|nr:DUF4174 domain-containing protein [Rhodobacteraceae bacterium D3-12]
MKSFLSFVFAALFAVPGLAQTVPQPVVELLAPDGDALDLSQFLWKKRLLVIFAESPGDPRFIEQMTLLETRTGDLVERDVVLLTDTNPDAESALRLKFRPRGFMLVLMGKDGSVYLRKPLPWSTREISRSIDKMPLRRQELRK